MLVDNDPPGIVERDLDRPVYRVARLLMVVPATGPCSPR
jgi:hypothetical protein